FVHEASVSLRESKGQIDAATAAAMGFDSDKMQQTRLMSSGKLSTWMGTKGSGYSAGSGNSVGSGKDFSKMLVAQNQALSTVLGVSTGKFSSILISGTTKGWSTVANVMSQIKNAGGWEKAIAEGNVLLNIKATVVAAIQNRGGFGETKDQSAGVTTLKGAMAVMDIAETATTNLDQIRAD
ncbi:TPA: hypothetical protein ACV1MF_001586, partial [Campylobacter jejuni]